MSPRYASPLLLSVLLIAGCAGTPVQESSQAPAPDITPPVPAREAPQGDVEQAFRSAVALMQAGDWRAAAGDLDGITRSNPELPGAWVNLGIARNMQGDTSAAEQAFRKAVELDPGQAEAWNQLGMLYRRSNRLDDARASYNEALKHDPAHVHAHWNLAILHDRYQPDPALALAHYEQYQQLTQSDDAQLQQWIARQREQLPNPVEMTAGVTK